MLSGLLLYNRPCKVSKHRKSLRQKVTAGSCANEMPGIEIYAVFSNIMPVTPRILRGCKINQSISQFYISMECFLASTFFQLAKSVPYFTTGNIRVGQTFVENSFPDLGSNFDSPFLSRSRSPPKCNQLTSNHASPGPPSKHFIQISLELFE